MSPGIHVPLHNMERGPAQPHYTPLTFTPLRLRDSPCKKAAKGQRSSHPSASPTCGRSRDVAPAGRARGGVARRPDEVARPGAGLRGREGASSVHAGRTAYHMG